MALPESNQMLQQWQRWQRRSRLHVEGHLRDWDDRSGGVLGLLKETWCSFNEDEGDTHAAAIGYYALFSLFPLIVLMALGLTLFVDETMARIQVMLIAGRYLPTGLAIVDDIVQHVMANRGTLSVLALVAILWGAIQIFRVLERSINQAWGAPRRRGFWSHLRFAAVMISITGVLTSISLVLTALFQLARPLNLPFVHWAPLQNSVIWTIVAAVPPLALTTALFILLYRFVPHAVRVRWRDVLPSALLAALLWEVAKGAFTFYMKRFAQQNYNLLYGSVGAILGLLTWVYLTGVIVLLGAELCATLSRRREEQANPPPIAVGAQHVARHLQEQPRP